MVMTVRGQSEQSPKMLMTVRGQLYDLLACCIPAEMIIRRLAVELLKKMDDSMKPMILQQRLAVELLKKIDDSMKPMILQQAAFFEHRMQLGSKPIFHLEAFIAK
ncbi:replication factor C, C-terminal domain-containing protein, partial [Baffinella frigidus]